MYLRGGAVYLYQSATVVDTNDGEVWLLGGGYKTGGGGGSGGQVKFTPTKRGAEKVLTC